MKKIVSYQFLLFVMIIVISSCSAEQSDSFTSEPGKGGSLARFTVAGNHLYSVDNNNLKLFDLANPASPQFTNDIRIGVGIETIFPKGNNLFIGSQQGMYIYDISVPSSPNRISDYQHIVSCDPVVVEGNYAYVTLRSENNRCGRWTNELQIIDISDLSNPDLIKTYSMNNPKGMGIEDGVLYVCDNGIKVYDATNTPNLQYQGFHNISANDVIINDDVLIVIGNDGLYQYQRVGYDLTFLSVLPSVY